MLFRSPPLKGNFMDAKAEVTVLSETEVQARIDAAVSIAKAEGFTEGTAKAATDERERISAIITSPHAVGREKLAHKMAFAMGMSAADAVSLLEDAPVAQAPVEPKPSGADAGAAADATLKDLMASLAAGASATAKDMPADTKKDAAEFAAMAGVPAKKNKGA